MEFDVREGGDFEVGYFFRAGEVVECRRKYQKALSVHTYFPTSKVVSSGLKNATIIEHIDSCKAKLAKKFKKSKREKGVKADLKQIQPQILIDGKPV